MARFLKLVAVLAACMFVTDYALGKRKGEVRDDFTIEVMLNDKGNPTPCGDHGLTVVKSPNGVVRLIVWTPDKAKRLHYLAYPTGEGAKPMITAVSRLEPGCDWKEDAISAPYGGTTYIREVFQFKVVNGPLKGRILTYDSNSLNLESNESKGSPLTRTVDWDDLDDGK